MTDLGIRAFARRHNVAPNAVRKAITNGRLERSVSLDARGRPRIEVATGDVEWERNKNVAMDREHNHAKRRRRVPLSDLNPPVAAVYAIRQDLGALTTAVWRMSGPKKDCQAVLDALQAIPPHLRVIEDELAARGVPLFPEGHPR
jgi:hypothetical protein